MNRKIEAHSKRLPRKLLLAMAFVTTAGVGANASAEIVFDPINFVPNAATALKMHTVIDELKKISGADEEKTLYDIQNEYNSYMTDITETNNTYDYNVTYNKYESTDRPPVIDPIEELIGPVIDPLPEMGFAAAEEGLGQQEKANGSLVANMMLQRESLTKDADRVHDLQSAGTTAEGYATQMQYANALAAEQSKQVMQLRSLTLAARNAEAARARDVVAREKRELQAASNLIK